MMIVLTCNITTGGTSFDIFGFGNLVVLVGSVHLFDGAFVGMDVLLEFDESGGVMGRSKLDVSHRWVTQKDKERKERNKVRE